MSFRMFALFNFINVYGGLRGKSPKMLGLRKMFQRGQKLLSREKIVRKSCASDDFRNPGNYLENAGGNFWK
jgi:hypothetical protein